MNKQVQETLRSMNEEQRDGLIGWLKKGDGHSVAGIERYTDLGLPKEWLDTTNRLARWVRAVGYATHSAESGGWLH